MTIDIQVASFHGEKFSSRVKCQREFFHSCQNSDHENFLAEIEAGTKTKLEFSREPKKNIFQSFYERADNAGPNISSLSSRTSGHLANLRISRIKIFKFIVISLD